MSAEFKISSLNIAGNIQGQKNMPRRQGVGGLMNETIFFQYIMANKFQTEAVFIEIFLTILTNS